MQQDIIWQRKEIDSKLVTELSTKLDISRITACILAKRGFRDSQKVKQFLKFDLSDLHNPYLLSGMKRAVTRICKALQAEEQIVVYGDYDVDGIASTSLLVDYLTGLGAQVDYYIPNRLTEGYGLNKEALAQLAQQGVDLIITVDCGIKAHQQIEYATQQGIEVIVTDHHTPAAEAPVAEAIINPHQDNCSYPDQDLCGVGVAFKLAQALALELRSEGQLPLLTEYLSLVALGTVADIVPLRGENRIITSYGLEQLNQLSCQENPGLAALVEVAGYSERKIKAGNIAFQLAPRINAAGRLAKPSQAVEMLLAADYNQAKKLASNLNELNNKRQKISARILTEAEEAIKDFDLEEELVLVLASPNWHAGVIGNVASDLQEKYHRPIVLIALDEEVGQGSCRSITNFNIHTALAESAELLVDFGGHKQAAGCTIAKEQIPQLRKQLNQYARQVLTEKDLLPKQRVDYQVKLKDLSFALLAELNQLAPFGYCNPRPVLEANNLTVDRFQVIGKDNNHLKLFFAVGEQEREGIAFNQADFKNKLVGQQIDLLFNLDRNEWQGRVNLQLKVKEIKVANLQLSDKLQAVSEEILAAREPKEEATLDWFYISLTEIQSAQVTNLSLGEEVFLLPEGKEEIVVLSSKQVRLGLLPVDLAAELVPYLEAGVKYRSFVSGINQSPAEVKLFITRELNYKSQVEEMIVAKKQTEVTAVKLNTEHERFNLLRDLTVTRANQEATSLVVWPRKQLVEEEYQNLKLKLPEVNLYRGHSALSCRQEELLLAALRSGAVDILLATPEFISAYKQILINKITNLVLADCPQDKIVKLSNLFSPAQKLSLSLASKVDNIEVIDHRGLLAAEKIDYLNDLLKQDQQILIYVANKRESVELTSRLWASQSHLRDQVAYYNSYLDLADKKQLINQFKQGQLSCLVATSAFKPQVTLSQLERIVLYQPSFNRLEFLQQVSYLQNKQVSSQLDLLYNQQDLQQQAELINSIAPNRELLQELYRLLFKLTADREKITISNNQLVDKLQTRSQQLITVTTIQTGVGILAELGLLTRSKGLNKEISLAPRPEKKLDLTSSVRYNECVAERKAFIEFRDFLQTI